MSERIADDFKEAIHLSGQDIYTPVPVGDEKYWIPAPQLEALLCKELRGKSLAGMPIRTRSKAVKEAVCTALGYPVPSSFQKTQPRFIGQQLDTYVQKSMNLQIWNEGISATRRYAIIQVSDNDIILKIRVVTGLELAKLNTKNTFTSKYQAYFDLNDLSHGLISSTDTLAMIPHVRPDVRISSTKSPATKPESGELLTVGAIYNKLSALIGTSFTNPGADQERNRGAALHRLVCQQLGYFHYEDNGQFPDIRHQLLEIKLQTSTTIDLGLSLPNSQDQYVGNLLGTYHPRYCDTRYAIFFAKKNGSSVQLVNLYVCTGADFFSKFRRFEGNIVNRKIQIRLPEEFFGD